MNARLSDLSPPHTRSGLVIAAPASGAGKTTLTLGLLRALKRAGIHVHGAKCGPDYIDPRFHHVASGAQCVNLDPFAMTNARLSSLLPEDGFLIVEGVMGLFDGAANGTGSTADLARALHLPVVLVVDAARMGQSIGALVSGFAGYDRAVSVAGVILNNLGSTRHEQMLRDALDSIAIPVLGGVARDQALVHPARHLGLVQAGERADLDQFIDAVADRVTAGVDLAALIKVAGKLPPPPSAVHRLTPPAQRIAVAEDQAFAFAYPHILADWRDAGAELTFFSPLADEPPPPADAIILPGGYPELHAGRLAANSVFKQAMHRASRSDCIIYGECGGYMVLGEGLVDGNGGRHEMLGLLALDTSFANPKLHLGYRRLTALAGPFEGDWFGHEFHYATTLRAQGRPIFSAQDSQGNDLGTIGLVKGRVSGSFAHLIDQINQVCDG